jgi:nuclease S1
MKPWHLITALVVAVGIATDPCFAWGVEGHRIIAAIAADELTPAAKSQIEQLLASGDARGAMMDASTWADEIRSQRPQTASWHFVDIPIGSAGYDYVRDCIRQNCVVSQIDRVERALGDKRVLASGRAEALRFLIHFIGDVHQPLHAADNRDKGGNATRVILDGRRTNLHAVWDVDVVRALGRSPEEITAQLEREITSADMRTWQMGNGLDWALESFRIASREIYAKLFSPSGTEAPIILAPEYPTAESALVRQQLEKAGVRLAWALNQAFEQR